MASYIGNIGFIEMIQFMEKATPETQLEMENAVLENNWDKFKELIKMVLKTELQ